MSLIMFDYDGVIADSLEAHVKSFLAAFHEHGVTSLNTAQDIINLYNDNVYESMRHLGLSEGEIDEILDSYNTKQEKILDQIDFFENMAHTLNELTLSHKVYIITSNIAEVVLLKLAKNGVKGIKGIMGSETAKSKIKKINLAMELHPELKAYYVGDTKGDIEEGKQAGVFTVGVAWGWHGPDKLKDSNPDYLLYEPGELIELLKYHN